MDKIRHGVNIGFRHGDLSRGKSDIKKDIALIHQDIYSAEGISPLDKLVYICISSTSNKDKITRNILSDILGVTERTIGKTLRKLEEVNLLERVYIPNENEYIYILKPIQEISVDK